ncbi:hypothetical protein [Gordonia sp. i37]|uniref:hypothetical protein n=1 Tax=Gordonia sp. i37 TaxID=1961707 RepID=UPI00209AC78D|nr:hypothetical protein [Gordonia sp. i37]
MTTTEPTTLTTYPGPPSAAASELIDTARTVDLEMGFADRIPTHPRATSTIEIRTRLHRWGAPTTTEPRLAGVILVTRTEDGPYELDVVIDPGYRATGVATSAFECIAAQRPPGFPPVGRPIVARSAGAHPAAARLARRCGAAVIGERHHLVLPSRSALSHSRASDAMGSDRFLHNAFGADGTLEVFDHGHLLAAARTDRHGDVGVIGSVTMIGPPSAQRLSPVVAAAADALFASGVTSVETTLNPEEPDALAAFRSAAFHHDRTDILYSPGVPSPSLSSPGLPSLTEDFS